MKHGFVPFAASVKQIRKMIKSGDPQIKKELMEVCEAEIPVLVESMGITEDFARARMRELVYAQMLDNPEKSYLYWYYLMAIVEAYGTGMLDNSEWYPCETDLIDILGCDSLNTFGALNIPHHHLNYPYCYIIKNETLRNDLLKLPDDETGGTSLYDVKERQAWKKYSTAATDQLKNWIGAAKEHNYDLILFYY